MKACRPHQKSNATKWVRSPQARHHVPHLQRRLCKLPFAILVRVTLACLRPAGCRSQIRTDGFKVMSLARYRASLPCRNGGSGRDRTFDACAFNAALYQLSYQSINLFRQCSQRTTRIRCTDNPLRAAGTSGRVQRMDEPMPSRNCATALFANTVEIGRGCTRITHQANPTDPRNYFAGIGTAKLIASPRWSRYQT